MAIQMYARYEVEVVGYTTDSVQIRFTAGPKDLCCWVPRDSLPLEEPIGGNPMSEPQAHLLMMDGKAVQAAFYDGIVGLGDPEICSIARFYHAYQECPLLIIEGQDTDDEPASLELDAEEMVHLYDALTPRIAYLRECAKREAGE